MAPAKIPSTLAARQTTSTQPVIHIEVVYADKRAQTLIPLTVHENCTVLEALQQSGILDQRPEINLEINHVGIFSHVVKLDTLLREGDRIEIYRALTQDPMQARRNRATALSDSHGHDQNKR